MYIYSLILVLLIIVVLYQVYSSFEGFEVGSLVAGSNVPVYNAIGIIPTTTMQEIAADLLARQKVFKYYYDRSLSPSYIPKATPEIAATLGQSNTKEGASLITQDYVRKYLSDLLKSIGADLTSWQNAASQNPSKTIKEHFMSTASSSGMKTLSSMDLEIQFTSYLKNMNDSNTNANKILDAIKKLNDATTGLITETTTIGETSTVGQIKDAINQLKTKYETLASAVNATKFTPQVTETEAELRSILNLPPSHNVLADMKDYDMFRRLVNGSLDRLSGISTEFISLLPQNPNPDDTFIDARVKMLQKISSYASKPINELKEMASADLMIYGEGLDNRAKIYTLLNEIYKRSTSSTGSTTATISVGAPVTTITTTTPTTRTTSVESTAPITVPEVGTGMNNFYTTGTLPREMIIKDASIQSGSFDMLNMKAKDALGNDITITQSKPAPINSKPESVAPTSDLQSKEIESRIAKTVASQIKDELLADRACSNPLTYMGSPYTPGSLPNTNATEQGYELQRTRPSSYAAPNGSFYGGNQAPVNAVNMNDYIRKDSIPCWGCSLPEADCGK